MNRAATITITSDEAEPDSISLTIAFDPPLKPGEQISLVEEMACIALSAITDRAKASTISELDRLARLSRLRDALDGSIGATLDSDNADPS